MADDGPAKFTDAPTSAVFKIREGSKVVEKKTSGKVEMRGKSHSVQS